MAKFKEADLELSREKDEMREVEVKIDFTPNALASVLYKQGDTVVLACCTRARNLPRWFPRDATKGWVNAEYSLLPGSTDSRFQRERRGAKGRTYEIERLVARSLRAGIDLEELGPHSLTVDCDILNADGGTRCASITAATIALRLGVRRLIDQGLCLPAVDRKPADAGRDWKPRELSSTEKTAHEAAVLPVDVAAISVGLLGDDVYLDLDYILDSNADVDMNVIGTSDGMLVEVQGTGEESTYSRAQMDALMDMAEKGLASLHSIQQSTLNNQS
ncbi:MAG: ribonuclease PH [Candidatus Thalassarchaeaceae archaeon]|jgi:ribonuclease PH|nr:ribonuclease PH [Candidatus Thalassarchaeaceae archaeon]MDP6844696.1 ribonuclease PH [Candidatus Thalassarchaeaceae archaeon]